MKGNVDGPDLLLPGNRSESVEVRLDLPVDSNTSSRDAPLLISIGCQSLSPLVDEQTINADDADHNPSLNQRRALPGTSNKGEGPTFKHLMSALPCIAAFSIIGVIIRFGLAILFGPEVAGITSKNSPLFTDIPANMFGCFLMGWVGSVLKPEITQISELLAIGLNTGLTGSITTFSSWNQSIISGITDGHLVQSSLALLLGLELEQMSYLLGMDTAQLVKWMGHRRYWGCTHLQNISTEGMTDRRLFIVVSLSLWIWMVGLAVLDVNPTRRTLWIGSAIGPLGSWARWFLSQLNGRGIGNSDRDRLKWFPIGTFLANIIAAVGEAAMALYQYMTPRENMKLLMESLQLGLPGCMSTVSTMIYEAHALRKGKKPWRAYTYLFISLFSAMALSIPIYSSPLWLLKSESRSTSSTTLNVVSSSSSSFSP